MLNKLLWQDIHMASNRLSPYIRMTPLVHSHALSEKHGKSVYLKGEHLQLTGAFKVRGATNCMLMKSPSELAKGVVCASAGNHAQGVAYAAKLLGVQATIVMPEITPIVKIRATENLGAMVVITGKNFDEAGLFAEELAKETGALNIHPFDDWDVIAGQGTIGLELLAQLPQVATVLVPVGGGGLLAGVVMAIKHHRPDVSVYGVEPIGAAGMYASLQAGILTPLQSVHTQAEGVAVIKVGEKPFDVIRRLVDGVLLVTEKEIESAVWHMMMREKMVVEYAGAVSIAALNQLDHVKGPVVSLVTGGNIDEARITMTLDLHMALIKERELVEEAV